MDSAPDTPPAPTPQPVAPRRAFLKRPLGLVTALLLLVLPTVLLAPTLANRFAPGWVEERFAEDFAGRIELGETELGWFDRQSLRGVRLFDPEGAQVAELDLDLPPLFELARGMGKRLGRIVVDARAELVADDAGESNLQRALAPRRPIDPAAEDGAESEDGSSGDGALPEVDLLLRVAELSWSDARTRAAGAPFRVADLEVRAGTRAGEPLTLSVDGEVRGERTSPLQVDAELFDLLAADPNTPPRIELSARIEDFPAALVDALADQSGLLVDLMGDSFTLRADGQGSTRAGTFRLELESPGTRLLAAAQLDDGLLTSSSPIELDVAVPASLVHDLGAGAMPEKVDLRAVASRGPVRVRIEEFTVPIEELLAAESNPERGRILARSAAVLKLAVSDLGVALDGEPIDLEDLAVDVELRPESPLRARLVAKVLAEGPTAVPGEVDWKAEVQSPFSVLESDDAPLPTTRIEGRAGSLPTAPIDRLAAQDGLLLDALGDRLDLSLSATWPAPPDQPLHATLSSSKASIDFRGSFEDGVLVADGASGLNAHLPLSPLVSSRLIGNLLPVLVNVSKPSSAAPIGLSVSDFRLPLDGDLAGLDATVRLEMGEVGYELLPRVQGLLAGLDGGSARARTTELDPFSLRIADGVLRYDAIPLRIDGQQLPLLGSFNLATRGIDFSTDLPLNRLRGDVGQALEKARRYLDPSLAVPIQIRGTLDRPQVQVAPEFLDTVVEQALQGAARKGLGDLLDRALGGG